MPTLRPAWTRLLPPLAALCLAASTQAATPGAAPATPAVAPAIAVTVDDLPAHATLPPGITRQAVADAFVAAFTAAGVAPHGFVNGAALEREPAAAGVLPAWRRAGYQLGNHGWAHRNLDEMDVAAFTTELESNEPLLASLGGDWRWFRYPFVAEGRESAKRDAARAVLKARGYRIAAVTMSFGDWAWNEPYARCVARHDDAAIARMEHSYLDAARGEATRVRGMARRLYGRDIPYVLLLHIGAFDARMLPRLLALYRQMGFGFTSLPQAEADPAYRPDVDPALAWRPLGFDGQLAARGESAPPPAFDLSRLDGVCR